MSVMVPPRDGERFAIVDTYQLLSNFVVVMRAGTRKLVDAVADYLYSGG